MMQQYDGDLITSVASINSGRIHCNLKISVDICTDKKNIDQKQLKHF